MKSLILLSSRSWHHLWKRDESDTVILWLNQNGSASASSDEVHSFGLIGTMVSCRRLLSAWIQKGGSSLLFLDVLAVRWFVPRVVKAAPLSSFDLLANHMSRTDVHALVEPSLYLKRALT